MKPKVPTSPVLKFILLALLLLLVVFTQYAYDVEAKNIPTIPSGQSGVSSLMIRLADLGFHPVVASFAWITTMPEILDLFNKKTEYFNDLAFVNAIDPKMSYPYAFSVLTLPAVPTSTLPSAIDESISIGTRGLSEGVDPDWRIPYYMALNYYLWLHDEKNALKYFDIAAQTPGVPQFAARFSLNFGIGTNERQKTEELWRTIASSTNDTSQQERAESYIGHLTLLDYIDAASKAYKQKFGAYPTSIAELVTKGIIPSVPEDPLGFTFIIKDGAAAVDFTNLPSYLLELPKE